MNNTTFIIAQAFGIIAVILGFVSYQMKSRKSILLLQIATSVVFCVHYLLLGALPALVLNALGIVLKAVYILRNSKNDKLLPVIFAITMGIAGTFSWQNTFSIFVILGLVINTLFLSSKNAQTIRYSILVTSPMVIVYNVAVLSFGGIIYESIAIISSVIGILRYRKEKVSLR